VRIHKYLDIGYLMRNIIKFLFFAGMAFVQQQNISPLTQPFASYSTLPTTCPTVANNTYAVQTSGTVGLFTSITTSGTCAWTLVGGTAVSGAFWPFGQSSSGGQTPALTAPNAVYVFMFTLQTPMIFSTGVAALFFTEGSNHYAFGVYSSAGSLLCSTSTGTGSSGSTVARNLTWSSSCTLLPGTYYLAFTSDGIGPRLMVVGDVGNGTAVLVTVGNLAGTVMFGTCANSSTGTSTLVFNASCGTVTAASSPQQTGVVVLLK